MRRIKMSIIKKLTAGLLTLTMIFSLAACGDTSWAIKADKYQVKAGVYIYYELTSYYTAKGKLAKGETDVFKSKIEDKDAKTWIKDDAAKEVKKYIVNEEQFDKLGLTLSDSDKAKIKVTLDNQWAQNGPLFKKNGISEQSMSDIITNTFKQDLIFRKYYFVNGLEPVSENDVKTYYSDNYARVKSIAIQLKDGEGNLFKSDDKAKALKMAEDYKSRATEDNFDNLIKEYKDYYADIVAKATKTDGSSSQTDSSSSEATTEETDQYANESIIAKGDTTPTKKFCDAVFSDAKVGETTIIQDDEVYYVVERLDILKRTDLYESNQNAIIYTMKSDEFTKKMDDWGKALNLTMNDQAINRYDPEKIKLTA